eukprot:2055275-Alexandrium_andersonii.AAC.1
MRCQSALTTVQRQQGHFPASLPTSRCRAKQPKWKVRPRCNFCHPVPLSDVRQMGQTSSGSGS